MEHYVKADFEYLNAFMQIYGVALSKSSKREDIRYFHERIQFILHDEIHPHHNFCDYIGVGYDELQGHPLPPTADHYVKHMMYHAHTGTLAETISALLPCPWTYLEIGERLVKAYQPEKDHPFYKWITFYAEAGSTTHQMRKQLDHLAAEAPPEEQIRIKDAFRKSCQLELAFWEMAYTCEEWPSKRTVSNQ
ncbi:thiaminase II [Oceanobacillus saliphilus]|uniref:thiaminase II n=1 Tax=Oceanobacillus saliphilus TaxID=2925834 RepID=UPI0034D5D7DB